MKLLTYLGLAGLLAIVVVFAFKKELDTLAKQSKAIKAFYLVGREGFEKIADTFIKKYGNKGEYFISGTPDMVKGVAKTLKKKGVASHCIKKDTFYGY